jgi:hypothetical protein
MGNDWQDAIANNKNYTCTARIGWIGQYQTPQQMTMLEKQPTDGYLARRVAD